MAQVFSPIHSDRAFEGFARYGASFFRYSRDGYGNGKTDDRSFTLTGDNITIQGILDGHGGSACAVYLNDRLPDAMRDAIAAISSSGISEDQIHATLRPVLTKLFLDFNAVIRAEGVRGGSTATIVITTKSFGTVCFVGDSPFVIKTEDGHILAQMTYHHSPDNAAEVARVVAAGGKIQPGPMSPDANYVFDEFATCLGVSRAFGHDRGGRGADAVICAVPDFETFAIPEGTTIVSVLCTDFVTEEIADTIGSDGRPTKAIRNQRDFVTEVVPEISAIDIKTIETSLPAYVDRIVDQFCIGGHYCGDNACVNVAILTARAFDDAGALGAAASE